MQEAQQSSGYETALAVWKRRKWLGILVFIWAITTTVSIVLFLPDVYRSTATILVERQKVPESFVRSTITSGVDLRLQTITRQILSRSRLEDLIKRFDLYADLRQRLPLEAVIARMRQDIDLARTKAALQGRGGRMTTAFSLSYQGADPRVVAQVTNTLASFYIEENLKVREQQAAGTAEFLLVQLQQVKHDLEEQEQKLSQYKETHIGELPEQLQANLAALERLNTQLRLNGERQTRASEKREALLQQIADHPETPAIRLERLKGEIKLLLLRYGEKYPDIVQRKAEIAMLEQELGLTKNSQDPNASQRVSANPAVLRLQKQLSNLDINLRALRTREKNLLQTIALYQQRVENTPRREQELQVLLRDYGTQKDLYKSLLKRQEEAKLSESLEQRQQAEQFRLLEPAQAASQPWAPKRNKLMLLGFMASIGLAVGALVVAEYLDTSFHTVDDLRAFSQVPVLVSLPRIVTHAAARRRQRRFAVVAVSTVLGLMLVVVTSFVTIRGWTEFAELLTHIRLQS